MSTDNTGPLRYSKRQRRGEETAYWPVRDRLWTPDIGSCCVQRCSHYKSQTTYLSGLCKLFGLLGVLEAWFFVETREETAVIQY